MYEILRAAARVLLSLRFTYRVIDTHNVPQHGPVILAGNHLTAWDPLLVACALSRKVSYMAKKELFEIPIVGTCLLRVGQFPVRRGTVDRSAIKKAIEILSGGGALGIFPEGTRRKNGDANPALTGVAYFAAKSGAQVVPVGITLGNGIRPSACVKFGRPMTFDNSQAKVAGHELDRQTALVMHEIRALTGQGAEASR